MDANKRKVVQSHSQPIAQKGGHMLQPLGEKDFALISNVFRKGGVYKGHEKP
jgi:hypothetical protein